MKILVTGLFCLSGLMAQTGIVRSAGQSIPGATVTAVQGDKRLTTVTDDDGRYVFDGMTAGDWDVEVSIFGFARLKRTVTLGASPVNTEWTLELSQFPGRGMGGGMGRAGMGGGGAGAGTGAGQGNRSATGDAAGGGRMSGNGGPGSGGGGAAARGGTAAGAAGQRGFQQVQNVAEGEVTAELARANTTPEPAIGGTGEESSDSFLINGTLSRGLQVVENTPDGQGFGPGGLRPGMDGGDPSMAGQQGGLGGPGGGGMAGGAGGRGGFGGGMGGGGFGGGGGGGFGGRGGGGGGMGGGRAGQNGRGPRGTDNGQFIGNRARRGQNQIRGAMTFNLRNSALDAAPYSVNGQTVVKPSYAQSRFGFMIGGPLVIPKIVNSPTTFFFINYNGARSRNPYRTVGTVPTADERLGDLSDRSTVLYDPTGQPLPGNRIPLANISSISRGLLNYIPLPNQPGLVQNYVYVGSTASDSDSLNVRLNQNLGKKDRLAITLNTQRRDGNSLQPFGFRDVSSGSGWNSNLSWSHTLAPRSINSLHWTFNRSVSNSIPYFAYTADVATELGIAGSSRDPINFGPPNVSFTNYASLSDSAPSLVHNQTSTLGDGLTWSRGKHNMSFGFDYRRIQLNNRTDSNARGSFTFSGLRTSQLDANGTPVANTGYDFADFLLGLPQSTSVRFGDTSTYYRGSVYSAYSQDDWRIRSNFSLMLGLRYEYFTPMQEKYGRIANLAIAPGFTGVTVVTPTTAGQPAALINPDKNNLSPRLGFAWKPTAKGKTQVRGGYGIYYNSAVYNQIASRMAAQPPFANTSSVTTSLDTPLTFAQGLTQVPTGKTVLNTYAVDPNYKLAYAQTWTTSIQRELPYSLVGELGYIGTKGTRLDIQRQPNRAAPGSPLTAEQRRQIGNAVGFTYESAEGDSIYHALQARLARRFRRGVSGTLLYTFGKSLDNSSTFGGAGNTVAQNDKDLRAERGLSSFDQRHAVRANFVWTSPIGAKNADTWYNRLAKDWTLSGGETFSSGTPLTARVLGNLADSSGTGAVGSGRADSSGLPVDGSPYFNLAAFVIPPSGRFGNAGRNTIPGPAVFSTNASVGRNFRVAERRNLDFRLDATNFTNHVTITSIGTTVNSLTYGLPLAAGGMRTVSANVRFRF